jgi:hypothetical protein
MALAAGWRPSRPVKLLIPGFAVAAFTIPAMWASGTHVHNHGAVGHVHDEATVASGAAHVHDGAAGGATDTTVHSHDNAVVANGAETAVGVGASSASAASGAASGSGSATTAHVHSLSGDGGSAVAGAPVWPRPWDPTKPIDLSGVTGVSPEQQARAVALVAESLVELPKYSTVDAAKAAGYRSIGDAGTGSEHYIRYDLIQDDDMLDPKAPESLVYTVNGDQRTLAGAMYIASARPTDDPSLTSWAGPLMQWHNHGNLCWSTNGAGAAVVVGIVGADGKCARGINTGGENPMVHVWITPHPCGVFAALEGVGAGQTAVSESARVDKCQTAHNHGSTPPPTSAAPE